MVNGAPRWLPNPKSAAGKSPKPTSAPSSTFSCGVSRGAIAPIGCEASTVRRIAPGRPACRASATCWTIGGQAVGAILLLLVVRRGRGQARDALQPVELVRRSGIPEFRVAPRFRGVQAQGRHLCERLSRATHLADHRGAGLLGLLRGTVHRLSVPRPPAPRCPAAGSDSRKKQAVRTRRCRNSN